MQKYLIEGSCDGGLFAETIEANSQEDAEAFAIERLCEAWGHEYGPNTVLDDLGDSASVRAYEAVDYARDAGPALLEAAKLAEMALSDYRAGALKGYPQAALKALATAIAKATPPQQ